MPTEHVKPVAKLPSALQSGEKQIEDVATLVRSPLLSGLNLQDVGALLEHLEVVVAPVDVALATGAYDGLWFVLEGTVRMRDGASSVDLLPSSDFGALALAVDESPQVAVQAVSRARLALLTRRGLESLGRDHPATALHLTQRILVRLGAELVERRRQSVPDHSLPARTRPFEAVKLEAPAARTSTPTVDGATTVAVGTRVAEVLPREVNGSLVVGGMLDHLAVSLAAPILTDASVDPVTTHSWEGREIFRRTAGLLLLEAADRAGCGSVQLGASITSGRVVLVDASHDRAALALRLHEIMSDLIRKDVPVREERWRLDDAVAHLEASGWHDAAVLLAFWQKPSVDLVTLGQVMAPSPGPLLPRTGLLEGVTVMVHPLGLLLDFGPAIRRELPKVTSSTRQLEIQAPRFGSEMTRNAQAWLTSLGATSIGEFNRACISGQVKELIDVSEGFHEKRIASIADAIKARPGVRVVCVAGPSSSGKTTFIKRLKVQLLVDGVRPFELSLDDYYLDRERAPRDSHGAHDFEVLEALDLSLLRHHVTRLLAGETVSTARYDFRLGKSRSEGGPPLRLQPSDVLLVEGIHALNADLLDAATTDRSFRIFIHPATAMPFDRLSIFEPADVRLLRRIVRDRHQRGFPAWDNLERWSTVRRAERIHIYPHQGTADAIFDSSLAYEVSVLRVYAERYLLEVPRTHAAFSAAYRLRQLLSHWVPIHPDHVPPASILREFIGGSGFTY